jgi:hypothetical protein
MYKLRVSNTGERSRARAGHVFPPNSVKDVVVKDKNELREVKACKSLRIEILPNLEKTESAVVDKPFLQGGKR